MVSEYGAVNGKVRKIRFVPISDKIFNFLVCFNFKTPGFSLAGFVILVT